MSPDASSLVASFRRRPGKLGRYAPWPLVGVALILVTLIVFTPVLFSNSHQPEPGILTQAELVIDKLASNATMHFYIWALGETIRYAYIHVGVAMGFDWSGNSSVNWTRVTWSTWINESNVLSIVLSSASNPVALNITAFYSTSTAYTVYSGVMAFYVQQGSTQNLISAPDTSGLTLPSPLAVSDTNLPEPVLLPSSAAGGS
jgi:hypothetical protein